ncbi:MAG TPA: glycine--tRNA ligase subunit beta [Virgibacillus sp.]|nr:glycine--tRNA ligase subunit beta [Virgibacillus sp.]
MSKHVLFEVGLEELPARFIDQAEKQLKTKASQFLDGLRISYDSITSFSTPRRLAVLINDVAEHQSTIQEEVRGPSKQIAQDADGNWTKAAIGFSKGQGKSTADLYVKDVDGTDYVFVENFIEGKATTDLLPAFKETIESIQFPQSMRWGTGTLRYARPIRWILALYGEEIISFQVGTVQSDNKTFGHRFLGEKITIANPLEYEEKLKENFVIANPKAREKLIVAGIKELELAKGFHIDVDEDLLDEVRNLVEYPTVFSGSYEAGFLNLPPEVLVTSMKEHQRYFPVRSSEGELLPHFISVRNGDDYEIQNVAKGNEKVLHARLSDGQFFFEEDRKQSIDFNLKKLERVIFQKDLGSMSDKVGRIMAITKQLAEELAVDEVTIKQAVRTAEISKFDLMTNMVNEFTELQGVMGEKYATYFGEDEAVAKAVGEHYLPTQPQGKLPETLLGSLVSIADKMDTIIGFIAVGMTPTGSQDPYGLRRQAVSVLRILQSRKWEITLESLLDIGLEQYADHNHSEVKTNTVEFFKLRAHYLLKEMSIEQDVIQSVLHEDIGFFFYTIEKAKVLSAKRNDEPFKTVEEALVRVLNIAKNKETSHINEALFETESERLLFKQYEEVAKQYEEAKTRYDAEQTLIELSSLATPIHDFFENNMVMTDDKSLRSNRLALLNKIAAFVNDYADLAKIQWKQHE